VPGGSTYVAVTSVGGISGIGTASVDTVVIPRSVTTIADNAFKDCANIGSFDFRCTGLTTIGSYAFYGITALTDIDLPDSVTSIGGYAFQSDTALTGIIIPDGVTALSTRCFYKCSGLVSVQLPDGLTDIGAGCFYGCTSLSDINFPSGLKTIGNTAFCKCLFTSIELPDTITTISNGAFSYCDQMTEAIVPSGALYNSVFSYCTELQKVTLGDGVYSLANAVFQGSTSLADLSVSAGNPYFCSEDNIVYDKDKTVLSQFSPAISGAVTLPDSLTAIKEFSLQNCPYVTSVTLPSGLTSVGA